MNAWKILILMAVATGPALAQGPAFDHLKCYSIRDPVPESRRWVTVKDFSGTETCEVKLPAALFCTEAEVPPPDPPDPAAKAVGAPAGDFLCYEVIRCDGPPPGDVEVVDVFGMRSISFHKSRLLCTPAGKVLCGYCLYLLNNPPVCSDVLCTPRVGCLPNEICDPVACPAPCPCCPVCGDGLCEGDETECNCAEDCPITPDCGGNCRDNLPGCGDGYCDRCADEGESHETCPQDCPLPCRHCE